MLSFASGIAAGRWFASVTAPVSDLRIVLPPNIRLVGDDATRVGDATLEPGLRARGGEDGKAVFTATSRERVGDAGGLSEYDACRRLGEGDEGVEPVPDSADRERECMGMLEESPTGLGAMLTTLRMGVTGDAARATPMEDVDGVRLVMTVLLGVEGESGLDDDVDGENGL